MGPLLNPVTWLLALLLLLPLLVLIAVPIPIVSVGIGLCYILCKRQEAHRLRTATFVTAVVASLLFLLLIPIACAGFLVLLFVAGLLVVL